jgi:hypothetical protein
MGMIESRGMPPINLMNPIVELHEGVHDRARNLSRQLDIESMALLEQFLRKFPIREVWYDRIDLR